MTVKIEIEETYKKGLATLIETTIMAEIGTYNCPDHRNGDTSNATMFTVTVDGDPLDLTGAVVKTTFRYRGTLRIAGSLESPDDGITITDASAGVFTWDKNAVSDLLQTGEYVWDTQIVLPGEKPLTWIKGTQNIIQDYTP